MSAYYDLVQIETVLSYCYGKTRSQNYGPAMHYGRLNGFFSHKNNLTSTGSRMAKFLSDEPMPRN